MKPRPQKRQKYLDPGTIIIIKQVFFGLLAFSAVALVITIIWYGTRISALTIDTVVAEGGVTIDEKSIEDKTHSMLEGSYLHLIPKRFAYAYPDEEILANVNEIDRIKNVRLVRISGNEIRITFDEYLPDTLWCDFNEQKKCSFLDETGYSFGNAPSLSGESLVRYFTAEKEVEEGTRPISEEDYELTKEFVSKLAEIEWYITKVEVDSNRDVFYTLARGGEIKAKLEEGVDKPMANLEAILTSKEFEHLEPGNFQYLDLRFGSKVYVNEELVVPEETATTTATITPVTVPVVATPAIEEEEVEVEEEEGEVETAPST